MDGVPLFGRRRNEIPPPGPIEIPKTGARIGWDRYSCPTARRWDRSCVKSPPGIRTLGWAGKYFERERNIHPDLDGWDGCAFAAGKPQITYT